MHLAVGVGQLVHLLRRVPSLQQQAPVPAHWPWRQQQLARVVLSDCAVLHGMAAIRGAGAKNYRVPGHLHPQDRVACRDPFGHGLSRLSLLTTAGVWRCGLTTVRMSSIRRCWDLQSL